jgi:hypothetical protein
VSLQIKSMPGTRFQLGFCLALALVSWAFFAQPAAASTETFFTGADQTYTVPAGVHAVHVVAVGAKGGRGSDGNGRSGGAAGFGARVEADLRVTPGEVLFVEVGGNGTDGGVLPGTGQGGFNGGGSSNLGTANHSGGGGGGATDLRTCSIFVAVCASAPNTLSSRLLVAGGGGGGGTEGASTTVPNGGKGGDADANGADGQPSGCGIDTPGGGGGAGTQSTGGAGGAAGLTAPAGNPGTVGQGGDAGNAGNNTGNAQPGGGGGGGFFGGGAGGGANGCSAGGGGGGSSFAGARVGDRSITTDTTGNPHVTITTAGDPVTVTTTADNGDPGSLRELIAHSAPGQTIIVPAGTYTLTQGELMIAKDLTISGHGAGDTVISGGGASRVFEVNGDRASDRINVTISGVTIRDGVASNPSGFAEGGGVLNLNANLTLQNVVVANNKADASGSNGTRGGEVFGGGIANVEGTLKLLDSNVISNSANAVGGGGLARGGGVASTSGTFSIDGSAFEANTADARGRLGAARGGGIYADLAPSPSSISSSTIDRNVADASPGPGELVGSIVGGGAELLENAPLRITGTTIAGNIGRVPGGDGDGGGLDTVGNGTTTLSSDTVSSNSLEGASSGRGGNLSGSAEDVEIENTIISGGAGPAGSENCGSPDRDPTSPGFNLDSLDQCGFHAPGDQVNTDPLLGPLADNGGPTPTLALAPNSPALDKGSAFGLVTDQRGVPRPSDFPSIPNTAGGDGSDIGAFELQAPNPIHPIHSIHLGKLRRNTKRGTAKLSVTVSPPEAGTISLVGKGLRRVSMSVANRGAVTLPVIGKREVQRALRLHGKRNVTLQVTYTPTGNAAVSASRNAKLIRKIKRR